MPGLVYDLAPDMPKEFSGWLLPRAYKTTALGCEELGIAKLVLMHCERDDSRTLIYESDVPYSEIETEEAMDNAFHKFARELDPLGYSAILATYGEHTVAIRDEDQQLIVGLSIYHNHFANPN